MVFLQNEIIEAVLNYIDENITENINVGLIAEKSGYSVYYFSHLFSETVGISLIAYVTWRKLQFASCDISKGEKVIDTAIKYGFETHGGFTKAFKKCFGFPPSLYILHINNSLPCKVNLEALQTKFKKGELFMNPYIIELTPFSVAGYPSHQTMSKVKRTADIPAFWSNSKVDPSTLLKNTSKKFPKSKHCEISMCYDVDINTGEFTYLLGRGIDNPDDLNNITSDMVRIDISGLYAIFSTQPIEQEEQYIQTIQNTWNDILLNWLPHSEFEYDETRKDFEYYDYRDHGWYFDGKRQMDICIPIRQREEAKRKAQMREQLIK